MRVVGCRASRGCRVGRCAVRHVVKGAITNFSRVNQGYNNIKLGDAFVWAARDWIELSELRNATVLYCICTVLGVHRLYRVPCTVFLRHLPGIKTLIQKKGTPDMPPHATAKLVLL